MFRKLRVERDGCVCSPAACAVSRRTLAASGKMSFVSLAWLTKAVAAKPRPLPPHGPTQRCRSCLDHAFDAHASEQYEFLSHPPRHSKHSGRGKCDELGKVLVPCASSSSTRRSTTPSHASLCESRSSRVAIWRSIDPTYLKHCAHTVASSRLLSCWMPTSGGSHRTRSPCAKSRAANNPRPRYVDEGFTRTSPWPGRPGARRVVSRDVIRGDVVVRRRREEERELPRCARARRMMRTRPPSRARGACRGGRGWTEAGRRRRRRTREDRESRARRSRSRRRVEALGPMRAAAADGSTMKIDARKAATPLMKY